MSHFRVMVIIPADEKDDPNEAVSKRIAAYDENTRVAPYKVRMSAEDVTRMAEFYEIEPTDTAALLANMEDWSGSEGGTDDDGLFHWSTYNPDSKWDWWCIGGRYCGTLVMDDFDSITDDCAYGGTSFHPQGCRTPDYHRNVLPMTELRPDWSVWAIVTPDGEWHEQAKMGWFATHGEIAPDWDATRYEIASSYPDHYAVCVDSHI